jgi:hypothetical protein
MTCDAHERARFLIDESRIAGIPAEDAQWLRDHVAECAECARHEETTARILGGLSAFSFVDAAPSGRNLVEKMVPLLQEKGFSVPSGQIVAGRPRIASWQCGLAAAAVVLVAAVPVYWNLRAARQEQADALLLEGIEARVSRTVPAAMEPLVVPHTGEPR